MKEKFQVLAAKSVLAIVTPEELISAADEALNQLELATPDMVALAMLRDKSYWAAEPYFKKVLSELEIKFPTEDQAIRLLSFYIIGGVVSRSVEPDVGLSQLMSEVYHPGKLYEKSVKCVEDSFGLNDDQLVAHTSPYLRVRL